MTSSTPRRKSPRIPDRDYAAPDCYMITINAHRRNWLFGDVVDGQMQLSDFGAILRDEWLRTAALRPNIVIDAFVVMPNHFHALSRGLTPFCEGGARPALYSNAAPAPNAAVRLASASIRHPQIARDVVGYRGAARHAEHHTDGHGRALLDRVRRTRVPLLPEGNGPAERCVHFDDVQFNPW